MNNEIVKKFCRHCSEEIHPMRLEILPHTTSCMKCTKEGKKAGRYTFTKEGEDISSTLSFHDPEEYQRIVKIEASYKLDL